MSHCLHAFLHTVLFSMPFSTHLLIFLSTEDWLRKSSFCHTLNLAVMDNRSGDRGARWTTLKGSLIYFLPLVCLLGHRTINTQPETSCLKSKHEFTDKCSVRLPFTHTISRFKEIQTLEFSVIQPWFQKLSSLIKKQNAIISD